MRTSLSEKDLWVIPIIYSSTTNAKAFKPIKVLLSKTNKIRLSFLRNATKFRRDTRQYAKVGRRKPNQLNKNKGRQKEKPGKDDQIQLGSQQTETGKNTQNRA
jgi:hypothetical protein